MKSEEERALDLVRGGDGFGVGSSAWVESRGNESAADGVEAERQVGGLDEGDELGFEGGLG